MKVMSEQVEPSAGGEPTEAHGPPKVTGRRLRELLADDTWLDELIDRSSEGGVQLTGEGGFLPELIKAVLERGLQAELTSHPAVPQVPARGSALQMRSRSVARLRSPRRTR